MSLKDWLTNGWLKQYKTSSEEIMQLFEIVDRDIQDAMAENISCDWRFGIVYNAALKLCTVILYAEGYRPEKNAAHYRTIHAISEILGNEYRQEADYLDVCRTKRNTVEYDYVNAVTEKETLELIAFVKEFNLTVRKWLKKNHSNLCPK